MIVKAFNGKPVDTVSQLLEECINSCLESVGMDPQHPDSERAIRNTRVEMLRIVDANAHAKQGDEAVGFNELTDKAIAIFAFCMVKARGYDSWGQEATAAAAADFGRRARALIVG